MEMQKVQGTITRLLTGLLLPVFLVLVLLNVITLFTDTKNAAGFLVMSTIFGYMFMAIPSLIYTLIMEFAINRRLANDYQVWIFGAVFGAASGLFVVGLKPEISAFVLLGALSGGICAYILRLHFKQKNSLKTAVTT